MNLKLAAALRRAVAGHHDGWGSRWKDTLSFIHLPAHSRAASLAEAPRLLFSIVCKKKTPTGSYSLDRRCRWRHHRAPITPSDDALPYLSRLGWVWLIRKQNNENTRFIPHRTTTFGWREIVTVTVWTFASILLFLLWGGFIWNFSFQMCGEFSKHPISFLP